MWNQSLYTETLKDKFTLSPLQKYQKYGRWPYKFIIGCCIVILTSFQAVFISNQFQFNNPSLMKTWVQIFLEGEDPQIDVVRYFTIQEFQEGLNKTLKSLEDLNDMIVIEVDTTRTEIELDILYNFPDKIYSGKLLDFNYKLQIGQEFTKPFNLSNATQSKFFWTMANQFNLKFNNIMVYASHKQLICWDIIISYKYMDQGFIQANIVSSGGVCQENSNPYMLTQSQKKLQFHSIHIGWNSFLLQISLLVLATIDLVMNVKYIFEVIDMYTKNIYLHSRVKQLSVPDYKLKNDDNLTTLKMILKQQKPWHQLSVRERMLFFDLYLPIRMLGNGFQIVASIIVITEGFIRIDNLADYDEILVGIGCFLAWFSIAKYMEYVPQLHLIVNVLESSVVPISYALTSFLPVFLAYAFLGMCLFGESTRFSSLHSTMITLVALIYQDSVSDITLETSMKSNLKVTMIYIVTYILLFIFAVNNIMVALIREQQDQRKQIIAGENDLMNEMDIKPSQQTQRQTMNVYGSGYQNFSKFAKSDDQSELSQQGKTIFEDDRVQMAQSKARSEISSVQLNQVSAANLDSNERRQHMSLKTVTKLAILLKLKKGKKMSKKTIEQDWSRLAGEEIQKNYFIIAINQVVQSITEQMQDVDKELWSDIQIFGLYQSQKKIVVKQYGEILINLDSKIGFIKSKILMIDIEVARKQALINEKRKAVTDRKFSQGNNSD